MAPPPKKYEESEEEESSDLEESSGEEEVIQLEMEPKGCTCYTHSVIKGCGLCCNNKQSLFLTKLWLKNKLDFIRPKQREEN